MCTYEYQKNYFALYEHEFEINDCKKITFAFIFLIITKFRYLDLVNFRMKIWKHLCVSRLAI